HEESQDLYQPPPFASRNSEPYRLSDEEMRLQKETIEEYRQERLAALKDKDWPDEVKQKALLITEKRDSGIHHFAYLPRPHADKAQCLRTLGEEGNIA